MQTKKVSLSGAEQTLLITLYAKAMESRTPNSLLNDRFADAVVRKLDYDFSKLDLGPNGAVSMALRAKTLDEWVRAFIASNPDAIVVNLGCGLDSRVFRVAPPAGISWFDVDTANVVELRRRLYPVPPGDYRLIAASVTESEWLVEIPRDRPAIVVAEGLMPYLLPHDAEALVRRIVAHFRSGEFVFDGYSAYGLKLLRVTPQFKVTGANVHWSIEDPLDLLKAVPGLKFIESWVQYDSPEIVRMSRLVRWATWLIRFVPAFRKIGRLGRYRWP